MEPISRLAEAWLPIFVTHTLEMSGFLLLVLAADHLGSLKVSLRYGIYLLALAKTFVPPFLPVPEALDVVLRRFSTQTPLSTTFESTPAPDEPLAALLLFMLWAASVLLVGGLILRQNFALRRRLRHATPISDVGCRVSDVDSPEHSFVIRNPSRAIPFKVFSSDTVQTPVLVGLFRPRLYFPPDWRGWSKCRMRAVLAHEMAHHCARDSWVLVLQTLALIVFGLNPLVWVLHQRLSHLRELRCDEAAIVSSGIRPGEYSQLLFEFLERQAARSLPRVSGISFTESAAFLYERFHHILSLSDTPPAHRWHPALPVVLSLALLPLSVRVGDRPLSPDAYGDLGQLEVAVTPARTGSPSGRWAREGTGWTADQLTPATRPVALSVPRPLYPERARKSGIEGVVYSQVLVDESGEVREVRILSGARVFHESVKNAARRSHWRPGYVRNHPVAHWTSFPRVSFRLRESEEVARYLLRESAFQFAGGAGGGLTH